MRILAYKGISAISWIIRKFTRSEYSHIGMMLEDMSVVEAWHVGGVNHNRSFKTVHTKGTEIDVFNINIQFPEREIIDFYRSQRGKGYDYLSVLKFLTRRDAPRNDRWFCSELCLQPFYDRDIVLLNLLPSHASPRDIIISPHLSLDGTLAV